jgi:S1-C subfamily serine protease
VVVAFCVVGGAVAFTCVAKSPTDKESPTDGERDGFLRIGRAERDASFHPFEKSSIGGVALGLFIARRTAIVASDVSQVTSATFEVSGLGGAAAISSDGYFVTAAHCLGRDHARVRLNAYDPDLQVWRWLPARVVWSGAPDTDFAILEARLAVFEHFDWATGTELSIGRPVVGVGFTRETPLGDTFDPNSSASPLGGRILRATAAQTSFETVFVDAPVYKGDSGSPLATPEGQLVGVIHCVDYVWRRSGGRLVGVTRTSVEVVRPDPAWIARLIESDRARAK